MNARSIAVAALLVVSFAVFGCSQSPEARRKEAQANADKFLEFIKANDPEGAYRNTFSSTYKSQQSLDSWVRFCQGMSHTTGPIVNYQVVKYDAPAGSPRVTLTYAIQAANIQDPFQETIRLEREGTEWKIISVEPQFKPPPTTQQQQAPGQPGSAPLPTPAK